jgi:hypothetical protein
VILVEKGTGLNPPHLWNALFRPLVASHQAGNVALLIIKLLWSLS